MLKHSLRSAAILCLGIASLSTIRAMEEELSQFPSARTVTIQDQSFQLEMWNHDDQGTLESVHDLFRKTRQDNIKKYPIALYPSINSELEVFIENAWQSCLDGRNISQSEGQFFSPELWFLRRETDIYFAFFIEHPSHDAIHLKEMMIPSEVAESGSPSVLDLCATVLRELSHPQNGYKDVKSILCISTAHNHLFMGLLNRFGFSKTERAKELLECDQFPAEYYNYFEKVVIPSKNLMIVGEPFQLEMWNPDDKGTLESIHNLFLSTRAEYIEKHPSPFYSEGFVERKWRHCMEGTAYLGNSKESSRTELWFLKKEVEDSSNNPNLAFFIKHPSEDVLHLDQFIISPLLKDNLPLAYNQSKAVLDTIFTLDIYRGQKSIIFALPKEDRETLSLINLFDFKESERVKELLEKDLPPLHYDYFEKVVSA